ncbi:MAG: 4a-hydroxytetrahydrobiopterin dehydratase [bacterium]
MATELAKRTCIPCKGGVPPLSDREIEQLLDQVDGWEVMDNHHLRKDFRFPDFVQALAAVNRIGALAEEQGHHPDLHLAWGKVRVEIWTHKIDGLTESDFILAAKVDQVV